jgi:hypothetical protein
MVKFKTRRGLALKAPSPYELGRKPPEPKPPKIKRPRVNRIRKLNYHKARTRLGLSPNAAGSIVWSTVAASTSFAWKHETLDATARWVIEETFKAMWQHPQSDRASIAMHFASRGFGVARVDILGRHRAPPIVIARFIAMVAVRRSGIGRNDTARRFDRDHTVCLLAERKAARFFEGINFNDFHHSKDIGDSGPTSDGEFERKIST